MAQVSLLSPAGNFECLVAAVNNGADGVYLGTKLFNARRLMDNFDSEELRKAILYAHLHQVKLFLTLNTLIKNSEIKPFLQQIAQAEQLGVDGIIIQDLSFAPLIKQHFPKLPVHASTQSTITNSEAVNFWKKYVDVFILARELKKEEIFEIYRNTGAYLETFVHGHLCSSVSGQCLISSLIGKRSGNRGMCASACRRAYNKEQYLLSAKDLCLLQHLKEVVGSGVKNVKIEGRLKPPEYVALTTRLYRKYLDAALKGRLDKATESEINELKLNFNREFTSGYFLGEESIIDSLIPTKRGVYLGTVRDGALKLEQPLERYDGVGLIYQGQNEGDYVKRIFSGRGEIERALKGDNVKLEVRGFRNGAKVYLTSTHQGRNLLGGVKRIKINLEMEVKEGSLPRIILEAGDRNKRKEFLLQNKAARPEKHPLSREELERELRKFQSLIFEWGELKISTDNSFIPKSEITAFRQKLEMRVLEFLMPEEKGLKKELKSIPLPEYPACSGNEKKLHVRVYSLKAVKEALEAEADIIYYDVFAKDLVEVKRLFLEEDKPGKRSELYLHTPMFLTDTDLEKIQEIIERIKPQGILINNWGLLNMDLNSKKILGEQANIFNDQQLQFYGLPAIVSLELSLEDINSFKNKKGLLFFAHGRPAVMTFREKFKEKSLTDERGYTFRQRETANGMTEMLYSKSLGLLQHTPEVLESGITQLYLDLEENVSGLVSLYRQFLDGKKPNVDRFKFEVTIGNLKKGVM